MVTWPVPTSFDSYFNSARLPYGVFSTSRKVSEHPERTFYFMKPVAVGIGGFVLDLSAIEGSIAFSPTLGSLSNWAFCGFHAFRCPFWQRELQPGDQSLRTLSVWSTLNVKHSLKLIIGNMSAGKAHILTTHSKASWYSLVTWSDSCASGDIWLRLKHIFSEFFLSKT